MTDRSVAIAAALRRKRRASEERSRLRKAGLLPPLPRCECGSRCFTDRWLPLCSNCASRLSLYPSQHAARHCRGTPRPLRLAADQILDELRAEARAERSVTDCEQQPPPVPAGL